jgi:hypothetical protein
MKFFYRKYPLNFVNLLKKHLNVVNYSLNIHIKKNLKLLKKKNVSV